jgi:hypothetical protein
VEHVSQLREVGEALAERVEIAHFEGFATA